LSRQNKAAGGKDRFSFWNKLLNDFGSVNYILSTQLKDQENISIKK